MSLCDNPVVGALCDDVSEAVTAASPLNGLAEAIGGIAEFAIRGMWTILDSTTLVDLRTEHFGRVYNLVFGIAVVVMLGFFVLQVVTSMLRREPGALARGLLGLAKSVLGSFVVVALTATLLEIVDRICLGIVTAAGTTMERMEAQLLAVTAVGTVAAGLSGTAGALFTLFLAGLAAGAAFMTWMSLLIRKALLLVSVVFAPLALAGATWDATRGWVARWAQLVVALILSKLVLVVVFLLATSMLSTPLDADLASATEVLTGIVLLLVAGFAPYLTYRAISFIGFDLYQSMHAEQEAKQALNRPVPFVPNMPQRPAPPSVLRSGGGASGGAAGTSGGDLASPGSAGVGGAGRGSGAAVGTARGTAGGVAGATGATGAGTGGAAAGGAAGSAAVGVGAAVAAPIAAGAALAGAAVSAGPRAGKAFGEAAAGAAPTAGGAGTTPDGAAGPSSGRSPERTAPSPAAEPRRDVPTVLRGGDAR